MLAALKDYAGNVLTLKLIQVNGVNNEKEASYHKMRDTVRCLNLLNVAVTN